MSNYLTRRDFLQFSATAAAVLGLSSCVNVASGPRKPRPIAAGAKVRFAQIGLGGKGFSDTMAQRDEDIVALCDIDWEGPKAPRNAAKAANGTKPAKEAPLANVKRLQQEFPNAKRYTDVRKMLVEMDDQIDAVGIAVPDHMHFLCAY